MVLFFFLKIFTKIFGGFKKAHYICNVETIYVKPKYKDMEKKYRLVPFDIERAKNGAEVVTVGNLNVEILRYDIRDDYFPILAVVTNSDDTQSVFTYGIRGNMFIDKRNDKDLRIKEEVKVNRRRMTNRELAWWLTDSPQEHREWKQAKGNVIHKNCAYTENDENEECPKDIVVRTNGGEWVEPLVEINE